MDSKSLTLKGTENVVGPNGATEDPVKLRAQIAETRNEMSGTIEELHGRLNPTVFKEQALEQFHEATETVKAELKARFQEAKEAIRAELIEAKAAIKSEVLEEVEAAKTRFGEEVDNAKDAMREATIGKVKHMMHDTQDRIRDAGRSARDVARENPIPAALATVGLAWLFVAGRRKRREAPQPELDWTPRRVESYEATTTSEGDRSAKDKIRSVAQDAGKKVADATEEAGSAVNRFAHSAKDAVSDAAHRTQDTVADLSHKAGRQARRVGRRSSELYRANPIAIGAGLLAIGTIAGLAIPRTKAEDEWMGGTRDDAMEKAHKFAHKAFGKAGEAVEQFAADDGDKAQSESASGQEPTSSRRYPGS